jgi:hypothetical protein
MTEIKEFIGDLIGLTCLIIMPYGMLFIGTVWG